MEKIVGSIEGVSGHTFDMVYNLYFSTERVIAVIIRHPSDVPVRVPSVMQTVFFGSGAAKRREKIELEKKIQERLSSLQNLSPDELLATHTLNFDVYYRLIKSIEIIRQFFQWRLRIHTSDTSGSVEIINFTLPKKLLTEAREILDTLILPEISSK